MDEDISPILKAWPYDKTNALRLLRGRDGREKLQIRVCLDTFHGILQLECDGRPDGIRPHGYEFALHYYEEKRRRVEAEEGEGAFRLSHEECAELFAESAAIYQRYVLLMQIGNFDRVIRDTAHNMRLFRFVNRYAELPEDRNNLERWWPYILRIHHTAKAMKKAAAGDLSGAVEEMQTCRRLIENLPEQEDETFREEKKRSLDALNDMEKSFREKIPAAPEHEDAIARLEREKNEAVRRQDYETAAKLRDEIRRLKKAAAEREKGETEP